MSNTKLPSNSQQFFFPAFKSVDEAGGPRAQLLKPFGAPRLYLVHIVGAQRAPQKFRKSH